jgi:hypothetical protein
MGQSPNSHMRSFCSDVAGNIIYLLAAWSWRQSWTIVSPLATPDAITDKFYVRQQQYEHSLFIILLRIKFTQHMS